MTAQRHTVTDATRSDIHRNGRGLYAPERQQALVTQARSEGRVSVVDAAAFFDVTPETIRRDLDALDRAGMLRRVHGGAIPAEHSQLGDLALSERDLTAASEKDRIAQVALGFLPTTAPAAVVLDSGSTTGRLGSLLPSDPGLTFFTNSPIIAASAAARCDGGVELSGGKVRAVTQSCVGATTVAWFQRLRVDVAFLGTNGLSLEHGLSTPDVEEAAVKAAMVRSARRVIVLADSRKIGVETAQSFCSLDDIDVVVTDSGIPDVYRRRLIEKGIQVVVA